MSKYNLTSGIIESNVRHISSELQTTYAVTGMMEN